MAETKPIPTEKDLAARLRAEIQEQGERFNEAMQRESIDEMHYHSGRKSGLARALYLLEEGTAGERDLSDLLERGPLNIRVAYSEEDHEVMALETTLDASAFASTPADALRELAIVLDLYAEEVEEARDG